MPFEEIAIALDISVEAAKKRAQRGLRSLRKQIEQGKRVRRQAV
jgi:DNA-directed RNA polymerase specialized sigma24 family protein